MKVILYSTGCVKCNELKQHLKLAGIDDYQEVNDVNLIIADGFTEVPALKVDGVKMNTSEAIRWCQSLYKN